MPAERYFAPSPLVKGESLAIQGQEFHHLLHVMRTKVGDSVEVVNGQGGFALANVERIEKKQAVLVLQEVKHYPKPPFEVILAQAIPKINRLDFIVEKGTELGMTQLWLFPSQRSERKEISDHQLERLQGMTIAAMKQCGSFYLPSIQLKPSLQAWESNKLPYEACFGDVDPQALSFATLLENVKPANGMIFFIGPESGLSYEEETQLKAFGVQGVKLHEHILRTDTAALVALSAITQYRMNANTQGWVYEKKVYRGACPDFNE